MSQISDMFNNLFSTSIPTESKPEQPQEGTGQAAYSQTIFSTLYDNITRNTSQLFADVGSAGQEKVQSIYQTGIDKIFGATAKINEIIPRLEQPLFSSTDLKQTTAAVTNYAPLLLIAGVVALMLFAKGKK